MTRPDENDSPDVHFKHAKELVESRAYEEAGHHFWLATQQGNLLAPMRLAKLLVDGKVTLSPDDQTQLFSALENAKAKGHGRAKLYQALMIQSGKGGTCDPEQAFQMLAKTFDEYRFQEAALELGLACEQGLGVPTDLQRALEYYGQAGGLGEFRLAVLEEDQAFAGSSNNSRHCLNRAVSILNRVAQSHGQDSEQACVCLVSVQLQRHLLTETDQSIRSACHAAFQAAASGDIPQGTLMLRSVFSALDPANPLHNLIVGRQWHEGWLVEADHEKSMQAFRLGAAIKYLPAVIHLALSGEENWLPAGMDDPVLSWHLPDNCSKFSFPASELIASLGDPAGTEAVIQWAMMAAIDGSSDEPGEAEADEEAILALLNAARPHAIYCEYCNRTWRDPEIGPRGQYPELGSQENFVLERMGGGSWDVYCPGKHLLANTKATIRDPILY